MSILINVFDLRVRLTFGGSGGAQALLGLGHMTTLGHMTVLHRLRQHHTEEGEERDRERAREGERKG